MIQMSSVSVYAIFPAVIVGVGVGVLVGVGVWVGVGVTGVGVGEGAGVAVGIGVGVVVGAGVGTGVGSTRQRAISRRGRFIVTRMAADVGDVPEGKSPLQPSSPKSQLATSPTIVPLIYWPSELVGETSIDPDPWTTAVINR